MKAEAPMLLSNVTQGKHSFLTHILSMDMTWVEKGKLPARNPLEFSVFVFVFFPTASRSICTSKSQFPDPVF